MLTWVNDNLGTTVQAGDALARVADLSSFRVRATISDSYADQLHAGDPVKVRSLQSALRDEQQLLKIGGGTAENVRQAELNLTVAQLEADRLTRQIQTQQRSNAADVRELGYTVSMQQRSIGELAT